MATAGDVDLFPRSERVFYAKAPLIEVVAQLRFPPILKIQGQPSDFQDRVRRTFPLFERAIPGGLPQDIPAEMLQMLSGQGLGPVGHRFSTEDRKEFLTLFADSFAYTTERYTTWENFRAALHLGVNALNELYEPAFFTRVGLRYIDAIDKDDLGLGKVPWSELLISSISGELSDPIISNRVESSGKRINIKLEDQSTSITLLHGLTRTLPNRPGVFYMIDLDIYDAEKTEVSDAANKLECFHDLARRAFRWCIMDKLHDALGPRPIDGID